MGIGPEAMQLYQELDDDPAFQSGNSVCELGSQDMQCDGHWWQPARDYMIEELGFAHYVCIDIDGRHDALKLDLNIARWHDVISYYEERFDIVTNHGTTEHCFNQYNCFKLMHDLTNPGGLMIHLVPSKPWRFTDDSFYYYSCQLFADLADTNHYEVVRLEYIDGTVGAMVKAVLRRTGAEEFKSPIQRQYQLEDSQLEELTPVPPPPEVLDPSPEEIVVREDVTMTPRTAHVGIER